VIFNFVGSIAGSSLSFIVPGGYVAALAPKSKTRHVVGDDAFIKKIVIASWGMVVLGFVIMGILLWNNVEGLSDGEE